MNNLSPLIVLLLGLISKTHAYEWNQLTENGVVYKTAIQKNHKPDNQLTFSDLDITEKKLTSSETNKKFPALNSPNTIVILGDTGCRIKEGKFGSEYQDCNDTNAWPLVKIVEAAGREKPDLLIHLGDYHYREQCKPGSPCAKMTPVVGYGWKPWELDFFLPMQKLLEKTPIIITRGNHEECSRAYLGYKALLASYAWDKECIDYEAPQIIILANTAIINFDSSSISDIPLGSDEAIWVKRFDDIYEKVAKLKVKNVWLITHKPLYGIVPFRFTFAPINMNLRNFFEKSLLKDKVTEIFSGHIHTSMIVKSKKYATQIVLGNSGTSLTDFKAPITKSSLSSMGYENATLADAGFGYALLKKNSDESWTIIFKDSNGKEKYQEKLR
ncbi:MAG: metallophosphoesterase [Bacteriovorax sp.]|nr:metallophosphoesterase [Bacteriovorax sp.]